MGLRQMGRFHLCLVAGNTVRSTWQVTVHSCAMGDTTCSRESVLCAQTLMLAKITPRQFKNSPSPYPASVPLPDVVADPLCSNIYSISERIILAWMNQHYEQMRHKVWSCSPDVKGMLHFALFRNVNKR